jgi:hypothetical protein
MNYTVKGILSIKTVVNGSGHSAESVITDLHDNIVCLSLDGKPVTDSALFFPQGVNVSFTDGIVGRSPEDTMKNIGTLTTQGMIETDRTILNILAGEAIFRCLNKEDATWQNRPSKARRCST